MKKNFLKVLALVGVLAFTLPVVGYCDTSSSSTQEFQYSENAINGELFYAVKEDNLEKVKELIKNGADVNCIGYDPIGGGHGERTVLMEACSAGNLEIAKLLIENGADVNSFNFDDCTAFNFACSAGNLEIIKLLIDNGADVNTFGVSGSPELTFACKDGNLELVKLLIENGADENLGEVKPLSAALERENLEIIKLLIENGADVSWCKECVDPILFVVNEKGEDGEDKVIEIMAGMSVNDIKECVGEDELKVIELMLGSSVDDIKEYEGEYKLDVVKTFRDGEVKPVDEGRVQHFGVGEDGLAVLFGMKSGGGIAYFSAFMYLKTSESVTKENIDGKEYIVVVNDGTSAYREKV